MMIIRHGQIEVLRETPIFLFLESWRAKYPRQTADRSDGQLTDLILDAQQRGVRYGFIGREDVLSFAELLLVFGPDLDDPRRHWWACAVLNDPLLSARRRLDVLNQRTPPEFQADG